MSSSGCFHDVSSATTFQPGVWSTNQLVGASPARWRAKRGSPRMVSNRPWPPEYMSWLPFSAQEPICAALPGPTGHRSSTLRRDSLGVPE
jgi:hypothetical protein